MIILLYGPPAAGKLTVAKAICASQPAIRLLDMHKAMDFVAPIIERDSEGYWPTINALVLMMSQQAMVKSTDLVLTRVYTGELSDPFIRHLMQLCDAARTLLLPVRLVCDMATLEQRVVAPSRQGTSKESTISGLRDIFASRRVTGPIPYLRSVEFDSAALAPEQLAARILEIAASARVGLR